MYIGVDAAYVWSSRIAGAATVLTSLEEISLIKDFGHGGRYDPESLSVGISDNAPRIIKNVSTGAEMLFAICCVRLLAGIGLLLAADSKIFLTASWLVAAATALFIRWRHAYGGEDGGDQMLTIMSTTFAACLTIGYVSSVVPVIGLCFIGGQACLAYATSGLAKLFGRQWRTGYAIQGILSTRTYGTRSLAKLIQPRAFVSLVMCWMTIVFETSFLVAPVLPQMALVVLLLVAGLFHACVAYAMGLNGFFWSFVATYPTILFLNEGVRHLL
jgi:hypothetical protein